MKRAAEGHLMYGGESGCYSTQTVCAELRVYGNSQCTGSYTIESSNSPPRCADASNNVCHYDPGTDGCCGT
ncbi:MAG: hypothetical protein KIS66_05055 [Fimbriimonadaceae bacterium]|nr:hypothetical protein [Fimbriimonadaceae bacterium]